MTDRPAIPENLDELSTDELHALADSLRDSASAELESETPDIEFLSAVADIAELATKRSADERHAAEVIARAQAALEVKAADEAEAALEDEAPAEAEAEEAAPEAEADEDSDEKDEAEAEAVEAEGDADTEASAEVVTEDAAVSEGEGELSDEAVASSEDTTDDVEVTELGDAEQEVKEPVVENPTADDLAGETEGAAAPEAPGVTTTVRVLPGVPGFEANAEINDKIDVAKALAAKWDSVSSAGTGERFAVVSVKAEYPEFAQLETGFNSALYDEAIVAACAPLQPYYGVGVFSSEARPVFDSLPKFQAPRGGVTVYPSPRFSNSSLIPAGDGYGQWTQTDDNNSAAEKNDAYELVCDSPVDYKVYGVYRSMNVRNMDAITFPELVAAHVNQLGARFARYADKLVLDAMISQSNAVVHASATYGATRTILSRFDQIAARYRENERFTDGVILEVWLPRWIRNALREDIIRAHNDSGVPEVIVDTMVDAMFADLGIIAHFTYDNPTVAGDLSTVSGTGLVPGWPNATWYIMSAVGNLALLDLGTIDLGVNPNGTYRDTALNKKNQFQMFMESFEGLVNLGAPIWRGEITVLPNGSVGGYDTLISDNTGI